MKYNMLTREQISEKLGNHYENYDMLTTKFVCGKKDFQNEEGKCDLEKCVNYYKDKIGLIDNRFIQEYEAYEQIKKDQKNGIELPTIEECRKEYWNPFLVDYNLNKQRYIAGECDKECFEARVDFLLGEFKYLNEIKAIYNIQNSTELQTLKIKENEDEEEFLYD